MDRRNPIINFSRTTAEVDAGYRELLPAAVPPAGMGR
jgi:hypothetical protein